MLDIAKGMTYLNKENVLHGNLCARNIMIVDAVEDNAEGYKYLAKVSDYQMTLLLGGLIPPPTAAVNYPSLKWLAPEALDGSTYNFKSDVWSFGITAIEILTRGTPFSDKTNADFVENWQEYHLDLILNRLPPGIPMQLTLLLKECLARENTARPEFAYICFQLESLKKYVARRSLKKEASVGTNLVGSNNLTLENENDKKV